MFQKIIAAEDFESASISVQKALSDLKIPETQYFNYCDDALDFIKKSLAENKPIELLITDLSFEEDYREQKLKSGKDLIIEARKLAPHLKILVFSTEKRPQILKELFDDLKINGFVSKGRMDVQNLKKAINTIYKNEKYLSQENLINLRKTDTIELTTLEFTVLELLSEGISQKKMPEILKNKNIKPNGLSSVEKTINVLKETFSAKSNEHLISICKDLGIL